MLSSPPRGPPRSDDPVSRSAEGAAGTGRAAQEGPLEDHRSVDSAGSMRRLCPRRVEPGDATRMARSDSFRSRRGVDIDPDGERHRFADANRRSRLRDQRRVYQEGVCKMMLRTSVRISTGSSADDGGGDR